MEAAQSRDSRLNGERDDRPLLSRRASRPGVEGLPESDRDWGPHGRRRRLGRRISHEVELNVVVRLVQALVDNDGPFSASQVLTTMERTPRSTDPVDMSLGGLKLAQEIPRAPMGPAASGGRTVEPVTEEDF